MRSEKEMYALILNTAQQEERIRGVYMNGSRTNPNAPKDIFQDYDIVYVVTDTQPFIEETTWIDRFGERLYMQYPEENTDYPADRKNCYGWLMQFKDGNRMDLHVVSIEYAKADIRRDRLCRVLLDKDGIFADVPQATDEDYWVKRPTRQQYLCVCNEFWWCLNNVAKGLWREEIPYVQDMMNFHVRKQLEQMLCWKVGIGTGFSVSVGKSAKYMYRWLTKAEWERYLSTYCGADMAECWNAVFRMCDLFDETAEYVGSRMKYPYNTEEGQNSRYFLERVRELPKDAAAVL